MSQKNTPPEPFGHFKAGPFGWTDCAETDEGAQPLYDQAAIDELDEKIMVADYALMDAERQRDELLAAVAMRKHQSTCCRCLKQTDGIHTCTPSEGWRKLEEQRDNLLEALKQVQVDISNGNCVMADTAVFVDAAISAVEQPKKGSTA